MISQTFDTNILIDHLSGNLDALLLIDNCDIPVISKIVQMEVMVGCKHNPLLRAASPAEYEKTLSAIESMTASWINSTFKILPMDDVTADFSVEVRKQTNAKLPDTVIHATAILNGLDLVTRNPGDFKPLVKLSSGYKNVNIIVPYSVALPPVSLQP